MCSGSGLGMLQQGSTVTVSEMATATDKLLPRTMKVVVFGPGCLGKSMVFTPNVAMTYQG